jgi:hypothetical protein
MGVSPCCKFRVGASIPRRLADHDPQERRRKFLPVGPVHQDDAVGRLEPAGERVGGRDAATDCAFILVASI